MLYPGHFLRRDLALTFFKAQLPQEPQKQQYPNQHILRRLWSEMRSQSIRGGVSVSSGTPHGQEPAQLFADIEQEIARGAQIGAQQKHDLSAAYHGDPVY